MCSSNRPYCPASLCRLAKSSPDLQRRICGTPALAGCRLAPDDNVARLYPESPRMSDCPGLLRPVGGNPAVQFQGLRISTGRSATSAELRVTRITLCTCAVAARSVSTTGLGRCADHPPRDARSPHRSPGSDRQIGRARQPRLPTVAPSQVRLPLQTNPLAQFAERKHADRQQRRIGALQEGNHSPRSPASCAIRKEHSCPADTAGSQLNFPAHVSLPGNIGE